MEKEEKKESKKASAFTKQQLLSSERYKFKKDLLNALIEDGKTYTIAEVDKMVKSYLEGKVE